MSTTPEQVRKMHRLRYGDLESVMKRSKYDHECGDLSAAIGGYIEALGQWLRLKFVERAGISPCSVVKDPMVLVDRLHAVDFLEPYESRLIRAALMAVGDPSWRAADILRALVTTLLLDRINIDDPNVAELVRREKHVKPLCIHCGQRQSKLPCRQCERDRKRGMAAKGGAPC
ncbi:hypothetical protein [Aeoliella sp.]|uniref:hypothetical protein n=1 Tax=Aeoliella sp. TaxID=2795800 RepID=UPI003CCC099F